MKASHAYGYAIYRNQDVTELEVSSFPDYFPKFQNV